LPVGQRCAQWCEGPMVLNRMCRLVDRDERASGWWGCYRRAACHTARSAAAVPSVANSGIGRQHPQPPTETSVPRRVRVR
jgi:hypothetical protein